MRRGIWEGAQKVVEVTAVVLDGTLRLLFFCHLLNEGPRDWVLSHERTTIPVYLGHFSASSHVEQMFY